MQLRQDMYSRIGATSGAYRQGTELYNARETGRTAGQVKNPMMAYVGGAMTDFAGAYGSG